MVDFKLLAGYKLHALRVTQHNKATHKVTVFH